MTQLPLSSQTADAASRAFNAVWDEFRDRFPQDTDPTVARAFAEAAARALTPSPAALLEREPVFFRYRHSEQEKWHYGPVPQSWWECQPIFALSDADEVRPPNNDVGLCEGKKESGAKFGEWFSMTTPEDWSAFRRFHDCLEDGEGYDLPPARMERLAELGLLRKVRGTVYEFTQLGLAMQDYEPAWTAAPTT